MIAQENIAHAYTVGDIVRTTESFGPNPAGSLGIVYETYPDQNTEDSEVVSVLLMNGHDIGSFDQEEQVESLALVGHVDLVYSFGSPGQLMDDYRKGYFDQAFAELRMIAAQSNMDSVAHQ